MIRRPPRSTRTDTLFPYTTLFRSALWGYPYVMEMFRFHLTLSGPLAASDLDHLEAALAPLTAPLCGVPVPVAAVSLFEQRSTGSAFTAAARLPLGTDPSLHRFRHKILARWTKPSDSP